MTIAESFDDNVFVVEEGFCGRRRRTDSNQDGIFDSVTCAETKRPESSSLTTARAQLGFLLPYSHSYTSLVWNGQYREYARYENPIKASQLVQFENRLNFSSGSSFVVKDESIWGFQEVRRIDTVGFVDDRQLEEPGSLRFSSTRFVRHHPEIQYDVLVAGAWGVTSKAERNSVSFQAAEFSNASSSVGGQSEERSGVFNYYDYTTDTVEARLYRNFNAVRVYGAAQIGRAVQDRSKVNDSAQAQCRALREDVPDLNRDGTLDDRCTRPADSERIKQGELDLGIMGRMFPSTSGDIKAGYVTWDFQGSTSKPFKGLGVTAHLEHIFTRRTRASFDLARTPLQASGQVSGYYIRADSTLGIERALTPQLYVKAALAARQYKYSGSDLTGQASFSFTDYSGDLQLRYRPGQSHRPGPLLLTAAYSPVQRKSSLPGIEYSSQRVTLSLLYGWF